ncbi:conserved phage C-terminal domain-containing protein [Draconibacterium mangrovi]|uniref:conserved phage C-terminal domain-containing protein n=1 Tax=Draconibacterium mangrovi TaxID=2697469 RepID=UPI0019542DEB|nr:conserved phage C-terminal domain-containing protein [Draconibacterium mangrovi]
MNKKRGFVKIFRNLTEWEWYHDVNTSRVFIHLLLTANFEETCYRGIVIPKGSVVTGRKALAKELFMSEQEVRTSLNKLKSTNEITIKATSRYSVVTICKWVDYQVFNNNGQPTSNQQVNQVNVQQNNQQKSHVKLSSEEGFRGFDNQQSTNKVTSKSTKETTTYKEDKEEKEYKEYKEKDYVDRVDACSDFNSLHGVDELKQNIEVKETLVNTEKVKKDFFKEISDIYSHLSHKVGKTFKPTSLHAKHLRARLREFGSDKETLEIIKAVIDLKVEEWLGTKMEKYLRPETLFNAEKFEKYLEAYEDSPRCRAAKLSYGDVLDDIGKLEGLKDTDKLPIKFTPTEKGILNGKEKFESDVEVRFIITTLKNKNGICTYNGNKPEAKINKLHIPYGEEITESDLIGFDEHSMVFAKFKPSKKGLQFGKTEEEKLYKVRVIIGWAKFGEGTFYNARKA